MERVSPKMEMICTSKDVSRNSIADMLLSPCRSFVDHIYIVYHIYFEASGKAINARQIILTIFFCSLIYEKYIIKVLWQKKMYCQS